MRLYKAEYVATDYADDWGEETSDTFPEPDGWGEHCMALWGEHRDFFPPTDRHLYRSRSAAQRRVDLINRWFGDGAAVLVEATCDWVPVKDANARREQARRQARIDKLRAQIEALTALDQETAS